MKTINDRTILALFLALGVLGTCFVILLTTSSKIGGVVIAQSDKKLKQAKRSPENNYGFTEDAPPGD